MSEEKSPRDLLFESDRGERKYYESKRSLKEKIRLPLTLDGCETILEMATGFLEIPLDDTLRQVFCGYVHHMGQTQHTTTLGEIGNLLYKHMSNAVTWKLDQDTKDRIRTKQIAVAEASKEAASKMPELTLAKDTDVTTPEDQPSVQ